VIVMVPVWLLRKSKDPELKVQPAALVPVSVKVTVGTLPTVVTLKVGDRIRDPFERSFGSGSENDTSKRQSGCPRPEPMVMVYFT